MPPPNIRPSIVLTDPKKSARCLGYFIALRVIMKLISFNINGLRARPHQLEEIINTHQPDVIGLQEIKVADEQFPEQMIRDLGYEVH